MSTCNPTLPPQSRATWTPVRPPMRGQSLFTLLATWIERSRQRQALAGLDDAMLRDVGITRAEAAGECEKPFWR